MNPSDREASVLQVILEQSERVLGTYRIDRGLIQEHANSERRISQGGYGDRQIFELIQNGADELQNHRGGKIAVVLTTAYLYCANQGTAITPAGVDTILRMGISRKRGGQIGRFGVGVKSVLSVTDSPQFFSRDDDKSFGFDREWSAEQIRSVQPGVEEVPVLRMAQPLDRDRSASRDLVLAELLEWATTVVRLPLMPAQVNRLGRDLADFPTEFTLFSSHVGTVDLEDRRQEKAVIRRIVQKVDGDRRTLSVGVTSGRGETHKWRVFSKSYRPSAAARGEAGELHDRPEIDISWAVPDRSGREQTLGRFWAYFPTTYTTTLRGIINAPWKTSEDRQNLYQANVFNEEMIKVAAELVVDSLELISSADDPCAHLDCVPARGREEPQWASNDLVQMIWNLTTTRRVLPGQDGRFGTVKEIRLHPAALRPEWRALWDGYAGKPRNWCHHSVEQAPHRRHSAERIFSTADVPIATVREWLEALVEDESPEASGRAILILAEIKRLEPALAEEACKARILLTESEGLVAPSPKVFRRSTADRLIDQIVYVDDRVLVEDAIGRALEILGVHEADAAGRFASVLQQGFFGYGDAQWTDLWELSRLAGPADTLAAFRDSRIDTMRQLKVRTVAGEFRRIEACLLPGRIVPGDGSRDARIAVDMEFHAADRSVLRDQRLGLHDGPVLGIDPSTEPWYDAYIESRWTRYCRKLEASASRPQLTTMKFDGAAPAGPLHFLTELSVEGRAAFLRELPPHGLVTTWTMQVGRQQSTREPVMSPLVWIARTYGRLETSRGTRAVTRCVSPLLKAHSDVLPVASIPSNIAEALKLPSTLKDLQKTVWKELFEEADASKEDAFPGKVYALLIEAGAVWPDGAITRCRVGDEWSSDLEDGAIAVTASASDYEALIREQIPALLVPTSATADQMRETWGMRAPSDLIEKELRFVELGESTLLTDEFPHLKISHRNQVDGWSLIRCSELEEITRTPNGTRSMPINAATQDRSVLVLRPASDLATLTAVDRLLKLGLGVHGCNGILERREQRRNNERLERARQANDIAATVLELVGEEALKRGLPQGLVDSEEAETGKIPDAYRVAQLAVDAHGTGILRHHGKDIAVNVPEVGGAFRGDNRSRQIVNQLHLPESFAGAKERSLDPLIVVDGPSDFPRLHDYQERLACKMFDLLTRYRAPKAMLCLPTGAGKTRVAAEAIIRVIKEHGLEGRPVLWIAQTEELCEQAVESWRFVWSKVGPEEPLTISRLWTSNEATAVKNTVHLVVATDAKLTNCLDADDYAWLRDAALVLVDEAHTSITPTYTQILTSLGLSHRSAARPLIGLTATPYRGFNEEETKRLVARFGDTRLDHGIFDSDDPFHELQELGVLAHVEHRELKGATIKLTDTELKGIDFKGLPSSAEQRLAENHDRNDMLIDEIRNLPDDGPVLVFATSVNHAKLMSAKLNGKGICAAAIESATPTSERRTIVEEYRTGKIRVLTNFGVLAQGFDAPATRTVIVARPTYSPNVYQQMIGRGLRGPRNGGKDTCLILDVEDNVTNYDKRLAFTGFEHLWSRK